MSILFPGACHRQTVGGKKDRIKEQNDGCFLCNRGGALFCGRRRVRAWMRKTGGGGMSDYLWTGMIALLLIVYLTYALLKPEKF
jgi:K+-transporting ATPase KdpF subunit